MTDVFSPAERLPGCRAKVLHVIGPAVCSDEGLTLETSATPQIPLAKNIPYQPLLIKPVFSLLANAEKTVLFKTSHSQKRLLITKFTQQINKLNVIFVITHTLNQSHKLIFELFKHTDCMKNYSTEKTLYAKSMYNVSSA